MINMIFSYFTDVSLISIILFVCCAYVVLVVNHLSEGLLQKKNYKFTNYFLQGELEYEIQENDSIVFISTLHGG